MDALSYLVNFPEEELNNAMMNNDMNNNVNNTVTPTVLSREHILAVNDLRRETITIPEWGGQIHVRGMTAGERDAILSAISPANTTMTDSQLKATLCVQCAMDAHGQRLFSDADVEALQRKNPRVLDTLANHILGLSGVGEQAVASIEKN